MFAIFIPSFIGFIGFISDEAQDTLSSFLILPFITYFTLLYGNTCILSYVKTRKSRGAEIRNPRSSLGARKPGISTSSTLPSKR